MHSTVQATDWLVLGSTLPQALILMHQRLTSRAWTGRTGHPVVESTRVYVDQFGGGPTAVVARKKPAGKPPGTPSSQLHATFPHG